MCTSNITFTVQIASNIALNMHIPLKPKNTISNDKKAARDTNVELSNRSIIFSEGKSKQDSKNQDNEKAAKN